MKIIFFEGKKLILELEANFNRVLFTVVGYSWVYVLVTRK